MAATSIHRAGQGVEMPNCPIIDTRSIRDINSFAPSEVRVLPKEPETSQQFDHVLSLIESMAEVIHRYVGKSSALPKPSTAEEARKAGKEALDWGFIFDG